MAANTFPQVYFQETCLNHAAVRVRGRDDEITQHIDMMSHKQACLDLEKATQFITQVLQHKVGRNQELCVLIRCLEEREVETGRSLTEQAESNRQLKLKNDELQKHLEEKDNLLSQANQTVAFLKIELRDLNQQPGRQQSNHRTIQELLQDRESQFKVEQMKTYSSPLQSDQLTTAQETEPLAWCDARRLLFSSEAQSPMVLSSYHSPPVSSSTEGLLDSSHTLASADAQRMLDWSHTLASADAQRLLDSSHTLASADAQRMLDWSHTLASAEAQRLLDSSYTLASAEAQRLLDSSHTLASADAQRLLDSSHTLASAEAQKLLEAPVSAIKEEDAEDGYKYNQPERVDPGTEQTPSPAEDIQTELIQGQEDTSPVMCSITNLSLRDPVSLAQLRRVSVVLVDFTRTQGRQRKDEENHTEQPETRRELSHSSPEFPASHSILGTETKICKNYSCSVCGKTFHFWSRLRLHQYTHTGSRPYCCTLCGNGFTREESLKVHQRTHTGEKPYRCYLCGNSFSEGGKLKRHQLIHSGEKPYQCTQCGKSFNQKGNLKTHQHLHT